VKHIETELHRIEGRLAGSPDAFEHAGLYAAQQALRWAAQPDDYASPFAVVTGSGEDSTDCSARSRPGPLSDTNGG
jgi:hypothetical protein